MSLASLLAGALARQHRAPRPRLVASKAAGGEPNSEAQGGVKDSGGDARQSQHKSTSDCPERGRGDQPA